MKLNKIIINRLPGISSGFELETKATVSVIIGPNGSGKSSLTRAVRHLLWPEKNPGSPFSVEAFFTWNGASWKAVREEGTTTRWMQEGQVAEAPDLPGDHVARCYDLGLLDLVLPAGGPVEQLLAEIINREMSGGVNLTQIAETTFPTSTRQAAKKSSELREATNALNALTRQQKKLFVQERELAEMQKSLKRRSNAATVLGLMKKLKERNEIAIELEAVRFKINEFPKGMDKVRPEDNETLASLHRQRQTKNRQIQAAGTELNIRQLLLQSLDLPEQLEDCGLLNRQVTEAFSLQQNLQKLQEDFARQDGILTQILLEMDPEAEDGSVGPQPGKEVYSSVVKAYSHLAEIQALADGFDSLLALPELQESEPEPEILAVTEKLRSWLDTNQIGKRSFPVSDLAGSLVSMAAGWVLYSAQEQLAGLAAFIFGASLAGYSAWQWFQIQKLNKRRTHFETEIANQCKAVGITLNQPFQPEQVQTLFAELSNAEATRQSRRALRDYLSGQHQRQDQKLEHARTIVDNLRQHHGVALNLETPELINLLNIIPRYRAARDESAAIDASIKEKKKILADLIAVIGSSFAEFGKPHPESVSEAEQFLADLEKQLQEKHDLQKEQKRFQEDLIQMKLDLDEIDTGLESFWKRLEVSSQNDDHLVRQLVDLLPAYRKTVAEAESLNHQVKILTRDFRSQPDLLDPVEAEKLTDELLDLKLAELIDDSQRIEELVGDISRIQFQVEQARSSLQVAEAQALQKATFNSLLETRDQARDSALGQLLLDDVQQTYHHTSRPKVLALASDNFKEFTHGKFGLRVVSGADNNGSFAAFDHEKKENFSLEELSDGTRAQLLLAVRLAFISANEGGAKPPLFLDESLTSSDPHRFSAIAGKLAGWAESQQRQIFYLSSNPNDAAAWELTLKKVGLQAPRTLDLATARRLQIGEPQGYTFQTPDLVPEPLQMTAAEYAQLLVVPKLDPWQQHTETHLWYLLADDLPQLHRLLVAAAPTLGRLLSRRNEMPVLGGMSAQKLSNIESRGHCLSAFFNNWRIGRSRPVTSETLIKSEAIGPAFLERCRVLLEEVGGDSSKFLLGLREKKVKRFATRKIDELEDYFIRENFMDPRPVLAKEDLLFQVLSVIEPEIKAGFLDVAQTRTLVFAWWELL